MKEEWKKIIWNFYAFLVEYYEIDPESSQIDFTFLTHLRDSMMEGNIQKALNTISKILVLYKEKKK